MATATLDPAVDQAALFEFLLRLGDNALILGHRVSEWCGHSPALEEDIALSNTALDLIGHVEVADLDGDQDLDLIAHRSYTDELLWFANDGTGSFTPGMLLTTCPGCFAVSRMTMLRNSRTLPGKA